MTCCALCGFDGLQRAQVSAEQLRCSGYCITVESKYRQPAASTCHAHSPVELSLSNCRHDRRYGHPGWPLAVHFAQTAKHPCCTDISAVSTCRQYVAHA